MTVWVLLILVGREPQILPKAQPSSMACERLMHQLQRYQPPHARMDCVPVSLPKEP